MMTKWLSLFSSLLGGLFLYFGIRRSIELFLPCTISIFPSTEEEHKVTFEKTGRYEICVSTDSRSWFRRIPESALFSIYPTNKNESLIYCPLNFAVLSRKDRMRNNMVPLGYFKVFSPGEYVVETTTPEILKKSDVLSIMPYISNSYVWATFILLLVGAGLFIGGTVFFLEIYGGRL